MWRFFGCDDVKIFFFVSELYLGVEPKIGGGKTPQIIHLLIGFSIIFTIHFGGFPTIFGNTHLNYIELYKNSVSLLKLRLGLKKRNNFLDPKRRGMMSFGMYAFQDWIQDTMLYIYHFLKVTFPIGK